MTRLALAALIVLFVTGAAITLWGSSQASLDDVDASVVATSCNDGNITSALVTVENDRPTPAQVTVSAWGQRQKIQFFWTPPEGDPSIHVPADAERTVLLTPSHRDGLLRADYPMTFIVRDGQRRTHIPLSEPCTA